MVELQTCLYRFASNLLVLRDNPILNHLPRLVVKWVNNIYVCAVSPLSSRHKKKIAFLAVGESKALNDKTVIYRVRFAQAYSSNLACCSLGAFKSPQLGAPVSIATAPLSQEWRLMSRRSNKNGRSTESRFLITVWTMCTSILATISALQEIPRGQDKLSIFVQVVIYPFYRLTARDIFLRNTGRRIVGGDGLNIFCYFLFNDLF